MRKLYLLAVAAGTALIPATAAQAQSAGHSWREGAPVRVATPPMVREVRQLHRGPDMRHRGGGHGRRFGHIQRINRGGFVSSGWWGPQFVVRNWSGYGFPQPFQGGRWIRYYDDALLIDRQGRVHDGRYGYDWDRHGDRWGQDDRGVPVYVGDGDYEPEEYDYEWAEDYERGGRDVLVRHDGRSQGYGQAYGYGAGYGCGCGPMVVTETTTTTAPVVELVTTYEYVTEYVPHHAKAAPRKRKVIRRAPAPARPRPGERG